MYITIQRDPINNICYFTFKPSVRTTKRFFFLVNKRLDRIFSKNHKNGFRFLNQICSDFGVGVLNGNKCTKALYFLKLNQHIFIELLILSPRVVFKLLYSNDLKFSIFCLQISIPNLLNYCTKFFSCFSFYFTIQIEFILVMDSVYNYFALTSMIVRF